MNIEIPYTPTAKQKLFHATDANEVLYGGAAGGGKLLELSTPILTLAGWKTMGTVKVGDMVFGLDGKPHAVLRCSPVKEHHAWRFVFDDGSKIVCDGEHLWFTYTASDLAGMTKRTPEYRARRRALRASKACGNKSAAFTEAVTRRNKERPTPCKEPVFGSVKTADEIVATLKAKDGRTNHAIPVTEPLDFPSQDLLLAPYLLGLWLGDGDTSGGGFTGIDGLEKAFEEAGFGITEHGNAKFYIRGLVPALRAIGVYGNKHVPEKYLFSSAKQRAALLQGLMDTDGCCNKNGSAEFCNKNKAVAEAVAFLVRSLGMKCNVVESRATLYGKDCGAKYTVKFTPNQPVFRMQRKLERQKPTQRRTTRMHYLVSVERVESAKMRCIAIDSPDHLYLAGHALIPTHNSKAIVMDALARCLAFPNTHAYCFRRTFPELEDTLIREARNSYPPKLATYNAGRHEMKLINGSEIHFRHCASIADKDNYRGIEIQWLYIDELTTFEQEIYDFLKTRLRAKKSLGIVPTIRCASNPGGIGHGWVKTMFVDRGEYGKKIDIGRYSPTLKRKVPYTMQYIPALATDNPFIGDDYITELERKPEALRKALLEGNWDAFEGQVFTEWRDDPDHYEDRKWTHVVKPFDIPAHWPRFMGFDHGYTKPFSVLWFAVGPDGCMYLYREWYGWDGTPDKGMKITPRQIAEGIAKREQEHEALDNIFIDRYADPAIFDKSRGESVAEQMEPGRNGPGVFFSEGDNARIAGKMQMHERLRFDDNGRPKLQVFSSCNNFIRTVPTLPYDERKPEDVDTKSEDHIYDSCRYVLMANPMPTEDKKARTPKLYDPFER